MDGGVDQVREWYVVFGCPVPGALVGAYYFFADGGGLGEGVWGWVALDLLGGMLVMATGSLSLMLVAAGELSLVAASLLSPASTTSALCRFDGGWSRGWSDMLIALGRRTVTSF